MSRLDSNNIRLARGGEMLPTIEVDVHDNYLRACACQDALAKALASLPREPRVTIYVYETVSINFGSPTNSIFFAVAGPERVLPYLLAVLNSVSGVEVRYSEYIHVDGCVPRFHLEKGTVFEPAGDSNEWTPVSQGKG